MAVQDVIVGLIVIGCTAYAAWALTRPFRRAAPSESGCGSCDQCTKPALPRPAWQVITIVKR